MTAAQSTWARATRETPTETDVIVVGTGFSGLCIGTLLARAGLRSFLMLERAGSIGGTWRDNTYPGAACDIQSHLYSFSFRPNPDWTRVYASQPEILAYLERTASDESLNHHIRFNSEVTEARWDAAQNRWLIQTTQGSYQANVLIIASGHLSEPSYPPIPGIEGFKGALFHSARWDQSYDWSGQRVGVVGTGASAVQIIPELAKTASQLTVFQRSAPYVIPRRDAEYSPAHRRMFRRMPETAQALRDELFWGNESRFPQRRRVPAFVEQIAQVARDHLHAQVSDPVLLDKLQPDYEIGCKRILLSNDYYPTLCQPKVTLETRQISGVAQGGIETVDGDGIDLDLLVLATGFEATDLPISHRIVGRDSTRLADHWVDGGRAFACTTVARFPNLFVMQGPNTGLGAGSIIYMVETQAAYISQAIDYIFANDVAIEPLHEAEIAYVASIDRRAEGSVWLEGGCRSWYVHPSSGRLATIWPDYMSQFRHENGTFEVAGYAVSACGDAPTRPTIANQP